MGSSTNFHITRNKNDQELCFCWRHTGFYPNPPTIIKSILLHTNLITNVKWNRIFVLFWLNTLPWNLVNLFCSVEHLRQIIFWLHATKQKHIQRFTIQQNDQKPTIMHFRPMASKVDSLGASNIIRSVVLSYYWFLLLPFFKNWVQNDRICPFAHQIQQQSSLKTRRELRSSFSMFVLPHCKNKFQIRI